MWNESGLLFSTNHRLFIWDCYPPSAWCDWWRAPMFWQWVVFIGYTRGRCSANTDVRLAIVINRILARAEGTRTWLVPGLVVSHTTERRGSVWFAFAIAEFSFSGGVVIRMEDCSFGRDVLKWKSAQAPFTRGLISIWKYGVSEGRDDSQAHLGFVAEKLYLQEFRLKHVESSMPIIFA